ncbi:MAG: zinc dependent phospholipase C family protein [Candidatus Aenigmarchaeota archaeon]|nr:zinc dependent phospholipase C family protein [Candidatus Aenigmarchaeota archaeon]
MKKILVMLIFLFFLLQNSFAWNFATHEFICEQIYQTNKELNKILDHDQFLRGCNAPDTEFNDQQNHHCYVARQCHVIDTSKIKPNSLAYFSDIEDCVEGSYFDCPAMEKFEEYIEKASENNFSFYVGVSTHYFTDAHVPVHQTMGEDYWKCHIPFEKKIDDNLKSGKRSWTVSVKCEVYFPCEKVKKVSRKCDKGYNVDVIYSYKNIVELIEKTDKTLSKKLDLSYESDYSHLLGRRSTGFFTLIASRIVNFFRILIDFIKG